MSEKAESTTATAAAPNSPSPHVSTVGFRWLDALEKDFDKNFVDLDNGLRVLSEDYDAYEDVYEANRRLLAGMGSCFIQLVHKAQTVLQNNAKFEAELLHLREELSEAEANRAKLESEKKYLVCRLQSALLENHKLAKSSPDAGSSRKKSEEGKDDKICQDILKRLSDEMALIEKVDWKGSKVEERCRRLEKENGRLRRSQVELESELVGARLDSKYLDKELAGRIQQIQILLAGGGTSQDLKQKVWAQIESEMHLQRSKTISNMCYSKQKVRDSARTRHGTTGDDSSSSDPRRGSEDHHPNGGRFKQVHIHKSDSEELGMAILGGAEHALPIMISEVYPDTAVGRCRKIRAGDVIVAVNGDSFAEMAHNDAVRYLSSLRGTIVFDLENRVDDEIDDVCDMDNRYYAFYEKNDLENGRPNTRMSLSSHPGRARKQSGESERSSTTNNELPEVHSPRKEAANNDSSNSNGTAAAAAETSKEVTPTAADS